MRRSSIESALNWTLVALVPLVALLFVRSIGDGFDLTKATVLWVSAPLIASLLLAEKRVRLPPSVVFGLGVLVFALLVSSASSYRPWQSLYGQYQRNTGLLTFLACFVLFIVMASESSDKRITRVAASMSVAAVLAGGYGVLQAVGVDPWDWLTPGQDRAVFGTLGNSNTTSGFVSSALPLLMGLWIATNRRFDRIFLGPLAVFAAASVGVLGAFQGVVAGVVGMVLVVLLLVSTSRSRTVSLIGIANCVLCAIALFGVDNGIKTLLMCGVALFVNTLLVLEKPSPNVSFVAWVRATRRRLIAVALGCVVAATGASLLLGGRVTQQVSEGMRERKFFYQAAWKIFSHHPILGTGLETFGLQFTRYRSATHATIYENNRSSSAHSVPIGMFANGGLLLGIAYLAFIVTIFVLVVRNRHRWRSNVWAGAVIAAWVATQVQSLVSVEHVALFVQQFVLAGAVVALVSERRSERPRNRTGRPTVAIVLAGGIVSILLAIPLTRPIRADSAGLWSLRYTAIGDAQKALEKGREAASLAPWNTQQRTRYAQALYNSRDPSISAIAVEVADEVDYTPPFGIEAAYRVAESGQIDLSLRMAELSLSRDPYAITLRDQVADLYLQVGQIQASQGSQDLARANLQRAIDLEPSPSISAAARTALDALSG